MTIVEMDAFEFLKAHRGAFRFADEALNSILHKGRLVAGELLHVSGGTEMMHRLITISGDDSAVIMRSVSGQGAGACGMKIVASLHALVEEIERISRIESDKPRVMFLIDSGPPLLAGYKVPKLERLVSHLRAEDRMIVITNCDLLADLASQRINFDGQRGTVKRLRY